MVVTLQFEVAQRLMSKPGTKDYGLLSLLVQLDFMPVTWFRIPSGCFFPPPDVDSACLVLDRRPERLLTEAQRGPFVRLVKRAFSQRRKMMLKLLKQDWRPEALETAYGRAGILPTVRAEAVSLDQFVELTRTLAPASPEPHE
jgi:16S rRNA (adenine1518-N6/adenine1519-N6)-dimethyltransferase